MPLFGRRKSKEPEEDPAAAIVAKALGASPLLQQPTPQTIAPFRRDEVVLGALLPSLSGEFSNVHVVLRLPLYDPTKSISYRTLHKAEEEEARKRVCTRGSPLVVKQMNPKQRKKLGGLYDLAAASLVIEAQYLARLSHPNIVQCRGQHLNHNHPHAFFFLRDRIVWTLAERIQKWKSGEHGYHHLKCDIHHPVFPTKIRIASDILSALDYLQDKHRMVLLNLSPDTIGFLEDGTVQLFDFGSCREIPPDDQGTTSNDPHGTTELTSRGLSQGELSTENLSVLLGSTVVIPPFKTAKAAITPGDDQRTGHCQTGEHRKVLPTAALGVVPRYLAPEVVTKGQYSLKSDSYSFCLVFYEMLTLSLPYAGYRPGQHMIKVCIQGKRPNLNLYQFPKALENLLHKGWRHNWNKRIGVGTMKQVLSNDELFARTKTTRRRTVALDSPPRESPPTTRRSLMVRGGRRSSHRKETPQHQSVGSNLHRMGASHGLSRRRQLTRQRSE